MIVVNHPSSCPRWSVLLGLLEEFDETNERDDFVACFGAGDRVRELTHFVRSDVRCSPWTTPLNTQEAVTGCVVVVVVVDPRHSLCLLVEMCRRLDRRQPNGRAPMTIHCNPPNPNYRHHPSKSYPWTRTHQMSLWKPRTRVVVRIQLKKKQKK